MISRRISEWVIDMISSWLIIAITLYSLYLLVWAFYTNSGWILDNDFSLVCGILQGLAVLVFLYIFSQQEGSSSYFLLLLYSKSHKGLWNLKTISISWIYVYLAFKIQMWDGDQYISEVLNIGVEFTWFHVFGGQSSRVYGA